VIGGAPAHSDTRHEDGAAMHVNTTRFGGLRIDPQDVFVFPDGLIGLENLRHWVLFADGVNDAVGWLQSTTDSAVALAVVSPRRFVPQYRVRISTRELKAIELKAVDEAYVLNIVSSDEGQLTVNLRAPLLFNLERRLARQVVTLDDQPVRWELLAPPVQLRKSA
jgi:flagellar assembly factor FliW